MDINEQIDFTLTTIKELEWSRSDHFLRHNNESVSLNAKLKKANEELIALKLQREEIIIKFFDENPTAEQDLLDAYRKKVKN
jgi:DNA-directed RNA polymerase subunit F